MHPRGHPRPMDLAVERIVRKACAGSSTSLPCGDAMRTCGCAEGPCGLRRLRIAAIGVGAFLALIPCVSVSGAEGTRRIVVLYPVSDGQPGIILFDQILRSKLKSSSVTNIEIYNEYLDSARDRK